MSGIDYAQYRMDYKQMARHEEIKDFSEKIAKELGWKIVAEKPESRVTLIMEEDEDRYLFFPHDIQDKANQEIHKDKEEWEAIQRLK